MPMRWRDLTVLSSPSTADFIDLCAAGGGWVSTLNGKGVSDSGAATDEPVLELPACVGLRVMVVPVVTVVVFYFDN